MTLSDHTREQIVTIVNSDRVVLFMKGTRQQPQCGFSAATVAILDKLVPEYTAVNVLEDPEVREGIKAYANWPTIPQLYIDSEFVGGCDLVKQMLNMGELHQTLGLEPPERKAPEITVSDAAAEAIRDALQHQPGASLHLSIDAGWQHNFSLSPPEGHEIRAETNGIEVLMDLDSAQRASGLSVDIEESLQGKSFRIDNPNAPPPVMEMSAQQLKQKMDSGLPLYLFDVRGKGEREKATIEGARILDDEAMRFIVDLDKDTTLVFYCHVGGRSQAAGEHFRRMGYSDVYSLAGGINAWSQEIDSKVPRY